MLVPIICFEDFDFCPFDGFRSVRGHSKNSDRVMCNSIPVTTRRILFASLFMYSCYHPSSRYLSGPHGSPLRSLLDWQFVQGLELYALIVFVINVVQPVYSYWVSLEFQTDTKCIGCQ